MGTILRGLQSVLIALGIIAIVSTGVILYYNTVKPDEEETVAAAETETADSEILSNEQTETENDTETEAETEAQTGETETADNAAGSQISYIEGHEHTYKSSVIKPSTCTEPGEVKYTCYCGDTYVDAIKVKDHTPGQWITVRAATDSQTGLRQKSCTVCGKVLEEETVPMLSSSSAAGKNDKTSANHVHSYTYEITSEASCTESGVKTYTCTTCGSTFETKIPATNHPSRKTVRKEGTCGNPGTIETVCNLCDAVISSESIYYEHDWGKWEVTTAATSASKGVKQRTCKDCGKVETKSTNATAVTYTGSTNGSASGSGSSNGSSGGGSTTCNHNYTARITVSATCTSAGTTINTCTLCGATTTEAAPAALGHLFSDWRITKPATPSEEGERQHACTRCGLTETESIAKTTEAHKHTWADPVILKKATCERTGTKQYSCTTCSYFYTASIPATGHSYDANGICTVCGAQK